MIRLATALATGQDGRAADTRGPAARTPFRFTAGPLPPLVVLVVPAVTVVVVVVVVMVMMMVVARGPKARSRR